jgi:hypothetical protein
MPVILALVRLRQEDGKFETWVNIVRSHLPPYPQKTKLKIKLKNKLNKWIQKANAGEEKKNLWTSEKIEMIQFEQLRENRWKKL